MKKLLLSILGLSLAFTGFAQDKSNISAPNKSEFAKTKKAPSITHVNKGATIFAEDFSNGLDGNNGVGAWTATDSDNADIWHLANDASPEGEFSTTINSLSSTTAANGWMIFDCDLHSTPVSETGGIDVQGFLTSPSIDMSAEPSVIIEFQQYFRYCCFGASPMALQVSNDGGTSWITFPTNDYFIESANALSDNAMTTIIDVSCAAGGQSDVMFRFAYNPEFESGYSHYFWGVDDVSVYGNANTNDLAIDLVTNGDIWNLYEYRVTPMEQVIPIDQGGLLVGTYFQNYGTANQTNVTLTIEVMDDAGTVLSTTVSDPFEVLSFANNSVCPSKTDSIYTQTGWAPTEPGLYSIKSTLVSADATDDTPENNTVTKSIEYTQYQMGHDDATQLDIELRQSTDDNDGFEIEGFGNHLQMNNPGSNASGVIVYFGPNTDAGTLIEARLYELEGFVSFDSPYESVEYTIEANDIPTTVSDPIAVFIEFDNPISLNPVGTNTYFVAVITLEGEGEMSMMANANIDSDFSTAVVDLNGDGENAWFNRPDVPAVRLAFDGYVGIQEVESLSGVNSFQNTPNPVFDNTLIEYTLTKAIEVSIEIVDVNGKLVYSTTPATQVEGAHRLNVDASTMADGVYFYSLISGNKRITKKMVVRK